MKWDESMEGVFPVKRNNYCTLFIKRMKALFETDPALIFNLHRIDMKD